jgi:hypothetical protein
MGRPGTAAAQTRGGRFEKHGTQYFKFLEQAGAEPT